jgi:hypothetical protein
VILLLRGVVAVAAAFVLATLLALGQVQHVYFNRDNLQNGLTVEMPIGLPFPRLVPRRRVFLINTPAPRRCLSGLSESRPRTS